MANSEKSAKKRGGAPGTHPEKRGRGRPRRVDPSQTTGRGDNYRGIFNQLWEKLWPPLSQAQSEQDVISAFEQFAQPYTREFMPALAGKVLKVIREPYFPTRRKAQANFLADSLAAYGWVSPRRSRDICRQERLKHRPKSPHHIIRKEYYVECSCGYKGPARDSACRKCGAEIGLSLAELMGPRLF